jgi:hypothetical protein
MQNSEQLGGGSLSNQIAAKRTAETPGNIPLNVCLILAASQFFKPYDNLQSTNSLLGDGGSDDHTDCWG